MRFNEIVPAADLKEDEVLVRFFGTLEIENGSGRICENKAMPSAVTWLTLKYLLVNRNRDVTQEELIALEGGKGGKVLEGAMRTRLRRVRDYLLPLKLGSTKGLLLYSDGKYSVNRRYTLITDEDAFNVLLRRAGKLASDDPKGLELCTEALELYRGPYLCYSGEAEWLAKYREHYRRCFCQLCMDMLERMSALDNDEAAALLWQRAIVAAPDEEALHKAIIHHLSERGQELELIRYMAQLSRQDFDWVDSLEY